MSRPAFLLAALVLLAAAPASAQEFGGVQAGRFLGLRSGATAQPSGGCRLSQTNVVFGVNRALGLGSRAGQRVSSVAPADGCRPLVSTGIVAGVNLGLGLGSADDPAATCLTVAFSSGSIVSPRRFGIGYGNSTLSVMSLRWTRWIASPTWWQWMQLRTTLLPGV